MNSHLEELSREEVKDFQAVLNHKGWRVYLRVLGNLLEMAEQSALGSQTKEDQWDRSRYLNGIRKVNDLPKEIINRGEMLDGERRDEGPDEDSRGTTGWSGYGGVSQSLYDRTGKWWGLGRVRRPDRIQPKHAQGQK